MLTSSSREPAGYVIFGGGILYSDVVVDPGVSHGRIYCGGGLTAEKGDKEGLENRPLYGVEIALKEARGGETPGGGGWIDVEAERGVGLVNLSRFCARKVVGV